MKFFIPNNTESRYSFRSRGFLLIDYMNIIDKNHGVISDINDFNSNNVYMIGKKFSYDVLEILIKRNLKFILDISDYKFNKVETKNLYIDASKYASAITTTCSYLADVTKNIIKKDIIVIPDPTERQEEEPILQDYSKKNKINLVWYGARKNLIHLDLGNIYNEFKNIDKNIELILITNKKDDDPADWINWNFDTQYNLVRNCDFVFLPVSQKNKHLHFIKSKGNNRPIDALRQGKFVITTDQIPSYKELSSFIYAKENVFDGIDYAINNSFEIFEKIKNGQQYIKNNYDPIVIAQKWIDLEKSIV